MTLLALDTVSLLRAAIPDGKNGWIKEAAALSELWETSLSLLRTIEEALISGSSAPEPGADDRLRWRARYRKALAAFRQAGIETVASEEEGADAYVALPSCWNHYVA